MPRKSKHETEESTVSTETLDETETTETAELPQDPSAVRELMARLKQERDEATAARNKANAEAKTLREHLKSLKAAKAPKAAKPARTLEDVIAAQAANPKRWTMQQVGLQIKARVKAGQPLSDAVEGVMAFYAEAAMAYVGETMDSDVSLDDAINHWLLENAPEAYNVNVKHSRKSAQPDEDSDSDEE